MTIAVNTDPQEPQRLYVPDLEDAITSFIAAMDEACAAFDLGPNWEEQPIVEAAYERLRAVVR